MKIHTKGVKNLSTLTEYNFDDRYVANNKGDVYRIRYIVDDYYVAEPMKPFITRDGYVEYVLTTKDGTKQHIQAHRIVAFLYLRIPKEKKEVNHKDGGRGNNKYTNLEWVSHKENVQHSFDKLGKKVWNAKK